MLLAHIQRPLIRAHQAPPFVSNHCLYNVRVLLETLTKLEGVVKLGSTLTLKVASDEKLMANLGIDLTFLEL